MMLEGDTSYRVQIIIDDNEVMRFMFEPDEIENAKELFDKLSTAFRFNNPPMDDEIKYKAVRLLGFSDEVLDFCEMRARFEEE